MSNFYHTPLDSNQQMSAANFNAPLGELDQAMDDRFGGATAITPAISDFSSMNHDHSSATEGGTVDMGSLGGSGFSNGDFAQWDGSAFVPGSAGTTPAGVLYPYAGSSAPTGYLLCYGQAVSRTTYADLFAVVGTTYGVGDGSTTFNLPDLRGRVPLGKDDMGGSSANVVTAAAADSLGGTGGAETHTLTEAEMPAHSHGITVHDVDGSTVRVRAAGSATTFNATTGSAGGGGAHNNLQPYITLNYIIKT